MLLQCIEVCYDRTSMMLSRLALGPIILWGLSFRCYGFSCLVQVELHAPCGIACLWMLLPLMRHCPLGTLSTSSICPRLNMVLDPVLVCISGLWVHILWVWSLLFTHVDFLMVCWYASCVFVLAAITLRIHTGRWQLPALLRPQRTCLRCSSTAVDDEAHCLFLCEHPTIVEARDVFLSAVVPPVSALSSLRYADFWALYSTGRVPLPVLVKYVAICVRICVRVGRQCHQSGGTDVVDLPDILLPEYQYLDMFDSESDISGDNSEDELVEVL